MKKYKFLIFFAIITLLTLLVITNKKDNTSKVSVVKEETNNKSAEKNLQINEILPTPHILRVPYVSEAPENNWTGNWVNACEEATIAMVEQYYLGKVAVGVEEAKNILQKLFDEQDKMYGDNKNADASQIQEIIAKHSSFKSRIKLNPTLEEIKNEIRNGRPVISLHRGFELNNKNIPFSPTKSSYHTLVLYGFDDITREFITHDPGDNKEGSGRKYGYDIIMNSLHDYIRETDTTDGIPTAIFTDK